MSPSRHTLSRRSSIDSLDDEYFDKTYVPLSNLPTPPLSSNSNASSRRASYEDGFAGAEYLNPNLLGVSRYDILSKELLLTISIIGPAVHLANLIPTSVSLEEPATEIVHAILTRADLPYETIALAVNILDSLNPRFAPCFRQSFPSTPNNENFNTRLDSINPELIPLAALILSVKFLDDAQQSTRYYVQNWARGMWTCQQVNYTERCLMNNLNGRLLPLWDEDMILGALQDMERAGRMAEKQRREEQSNFACQSGMSAGKAVFNAHHQLTPGESPPLLADKLRTLHLGEVPTFRLNDGVQEQVLQLY